MSRKPSIHTTLINADDSCLIVVDVQKAFLEKLPEGESEQFIRRLLWLVKVATRLGIPLVVTAEDIEKNGSIIPELEMILPTDTQVHNKMVFGLAADSGILLDIQNTKRNTMILVGLETDVCVAHSAIGLLEEGYQVVVVEDSSASPGNAHSYGLSRIKAAGALVSNVKALYYEWMRTLDKCREFHRRYKDELGDSGVML